MGPAGLDYCAVETVMRLMGVEEPLQTLDKVMIMEDESMKVFREMRERG